MGGCSCCFVADEGSDENVFMLLSSIGIRIVPHHDDEEHPEVPM